MRPVDPARSKIVLFGVPQYDDPGWGKVPAITNNINDLFKLFTDRRIGGFDAANCIVVPADAKARDIGKILVDAGQEAEDLLLFYFAGHGALSFQHELYLCLSETDSNEAMLDFVGLPFGAIRSAFLRSTAASHVAILDCCFSGHANREILGPAQQDDLEKRLEVAGSYILTASPPYREAWYEPGERHTAFTGLLVNLLSRGIPGAGSRLTLDEISARLKSQCIAKGLPLSQSSKTDTAGSLGLVRNRSYRVAGSEKLTSDSVGEISPDPVLSFARSTLNGFKRAAAAVRAARAAGILGTPYAPRIGRVDRPDQLNAHPSLSLGRESLPSAEPARADNDPASALQSSRSDPEMERLRFAAANAAIRTCYALATIYLGLAAWVGIAPGVSLGWLILLIPGILCYSVTGVACAASHKAQNHVAEYLLIAIGNLVSAIGAIAVAIGATTAWVAPIFVIGCIVTARSRSMTEHLEPHQI